MCSLCLYTWCLCSRDLLPLHSIKINVNRINLLLNETAPGKDYVNVGVLVSRPGFCLETTQDHFFEVLDLVLAYVVLVLVLVSKSGLEKEQVTYSRLLID